MLTMRRSPTNRRFLQPAQLYKQKGPEPGFGPKAAYLQ